jgi:hypothetical protein
VQGNLTNRVWPRERVSNWKLDVIFFEGNVGARKSLSCRDTWLQRNEPKVFWPRDWLPQDVHKDIRVLVLEYCISGKWTEGLLTDIKKSLIFRCELQGYLPKTVTIPEPDNFYPLCTFQQLESTPSTHNVHFLYSDGFWVHIPYTFSLLEELAFPFSYLVKIWNFMSAGGRVLMYSFSDVAVTGGTRNGRGSGQLSL